VVSKDDPSTGTTVLRRDGGHGIWIVDDRLAFSEADLAAREVTLDDVRDALGPPRASLVIAALGLVVAGVLELRRRLERARWRAWRAASPASPRRTAGSRSTMASGRCTSKANAPAHSRGRRGPAREAAVPGVYRGDGPLGKVTVIVGDKLDLLERGHASLAALGAQVLATVALTSAPLFAAAIRGLVF